MTRLPGAFAGTGDAATEKGATLVRLARQIFTPQHYVLAKYLLVNGQIQASTRHFAEAESSFQESWQILRASTSTSRILEVELLRTIIACYAQQGGASRSADATEKARVWQQRLEAANSPEK